MKQLLRANSLLPASFNCCVDRGGISCKEQAKDLPENHFLDQEGDGYREDQSTDDRHECYCELHMSSPLLVDVRGNAEARC
jgi:hypothetical protein